MKVLISGASVAGPTLAFWLARHGHQATVVEAAPRPRAGGYPIDVRGQAVEVAERMGLLGRIRELSVATEGIDFVGGRRPVSVDMRRLRGAAGVRDLELLRGDLVRTLYEATEHDAEYRFGDSVATLAQDGHGVDVAFDSGATDRFDVVVGADGLHSNVRRLAFGPEAGYRTYLGLYVAGASVGTGLGVPGRCVLHTVPGRAAGVYRFGGTASAIFLFRRAIEPSYDFRDVAQHKRLVADEFAGVDRTAGLLRDALAADDFYFDSVSQIRMASWSRGRVALAGDAGYGPALLSGAGTTLAMVGAYLLAGALSEADDPAPAFARYAATLRPTVVRAQRSAGAGAGMLVPATEGAVRRRDALARLAGPQWAAARLSRYLPRRRTTLPDYPVGRRTGV
jgi:2-polyprenyl-6-methoxyphenol hydroxylase-like FAD-dependent oxidoreductase